MGVEAVDIGAEELCGSNRPGDIGRCGLLTAGGGVADDSMMGVSRIVSGRGEVGNMEGEDNLVSTVFSCCASSAVAALGAGLCAVVELGSATGDGAFSSREMVHISLHTKVNYSKLFCYLMYHRHLMLKRLIQQWLSSI